jgi:hypothetical protein
MDEHTSQDWSVTFTYDAAADEGTLRRIEDSLEHCVDVGAFVAAAPLDHRVTVTLFLRAHDPGDAIEYGREALLHVGARESFDGLPVAIEAVTAAEQERRAELPTLPELVGASEVGDMLGVSRQRVHQLRDHAAFPAPLVEVAMGPLWDARAVEAFARAWSRRPGRPPLAVAQ